MKIFTAIISAILVLAGYSAHAATATIDLSVGGEISPGVYGHVRLGNAPPPPIFYPQPKIIVSQPGREMSEPIYMHVPPGHARNWSKYCHKYDACNNPVYFVKSAEYEPGYSKRQKKDKHGEMRQNEKHHGGKNSRDERRGKKQDDDDRHGDDRRDRGKQD